tara:strand:- start:909 stop:1373 length:465 start_codon:yes stop_codon:yes gene_type:complete
MKTESQKPILTEILPIELTNSNDGQGHSWHRGAKFRKQVERKLAAQGFRREPFPWLVRLEITRVLGRRQSKWDSSSVLRGNWKEIEDALVVLGWFEDDSTKFISHSAGYQDDTRRADGPCIEVRVFKSCDHQWHEVQCDGAGTCRQCAKCGHYS